MLGGNKRMLRAAGGSLGSLVHAGQAEAQVVLHLERTGPAAEHLAIKRTLSAASGRTPTFVLHSTGKSPPALSSSGLEEGAVGAPPPPPWRAVSAQELQQLLQQPPWGINTQVVDRFIVTQQRQAVAAAADPVLLAAHLEVLLGTDHIAERVAAHERQLDACGTESTLLEQEADRCGLPRRGGTLARRWPDAGRGPNMLRGGTLQAGGALPGAAAARAALAAARQRRAGAGRAQAAAAAPHVQVARVGHRPGPAQGGCGDEASGERQAVRTRHAAERRGGALPAGQSRRRVKRRRRRSGRSTRRPRRRLSWAPPARATGARRSGWPGCRRSAQRPAPRCGRPLKRQLFCCSVCCSELHRFL